MTSEVLAAGHVTVSSTHGRKDYQWSCPFSTKILVTPLVKYFHFDWFSIDINDLPTTDRLGNRRSDLKQASALGDRLQKHCRQVINRRKRCSREMYASGYRHLGADTRHAEGRCTVQRRSNVLCTSYRPLPPSTSEPPVFLINHRSPTITEHYWVDSVCMEPLAIKTVYTVFVIIKLLCRF